MWLQRLCPNAERKEEGKEGRGFIHMKDPQCNPQMSEGGQGKTFSFNLTLISEWLFFFYVFVPISQSGTSGLRHIMLVSPFHCLFAFMCIHLSGFFGRVTDVTNPTIACLLFIHSWKEESCQSFVCMLLPHLHPPRLPSFRSKRRKEAMQGPFWPSSVFKSSLFLIVHEPLRRVAWLMTMHMWLVF